MPPFHVLGLDDYLWWAFQLLHDSGAVDSEPAEVTFYDVETLAEDGTVERLAVADRHVLTFHDGSRLQASFIVGERIDGTHGEIIGLEVHEYSFHYRDANDALIWRYDRHAEAHHGFDVPTHVHLGSEDDVSPTEAVEVDVVLSEVWQHLSSDED